MANKTLVKVSGTWKEVKNVWMKVGGIWKDKITPKGNVSNAWKHFINYSQKLYDLGVEHILFIQGLLSRATSVQKLSDHLYVIMSDSKGGASYSHVVSDEKINLSSFNTLYIDWSRVSGNLESYGFICILNGKSDSYTNAVAIFEESANINSGRHISTLDISSLSGEYYVCFGARGSDSNKDSYNVQLRTYKMWIE